MSQKNLNNINHRLFLIWTMAKTDYTQRYYGSRLGLLWALINPIFRLFIYYVVFAFLIFRDKEPIFILYLFAGLIFWTYFAQNTNKGVTLLKSKKYLIQNVTINKEDIFISSALSTSFSFFLNIAVYFLFSFFFDIDFTFSTLNIFLLFIVLYLFVLGVSMILASLYLYLNDLKHLWDMVILAGFWTVPIIWDYQIVLNEYKFLLYLNPVTGLIVNARYILLYGMPMDWSIFLYDLIYVLIFLLIGLFILKGYSYKAVETQ